LIDRETLEAAAAGKRIGTVHVVTENIFDPRKPGEGRGLFRLVNRLHRTTRPEVIERQLLFQPGDTFSPEAARETERLLRANRFLYEASIHPVDGDGGKVDLEVLTRDVWTLQGGLNFHRAGGTNSTEFDLEDENLLGTGKDLQVARKSDVDRTSKLVRYRDPSLAGSRALLDLALSDNSDGSTRVLSVDRPFFALDTRWALGLGALHDDRVDRLYDGGQIVDGFRHQSDGFEAYAGLSPGLADDAAQRFRLGFTYDRERFAPAPASFQLPSAFGAMGPSFAAIPGGAPATGFLGPAGGLAARADRTLAYPWIGYEYFEDGFVTIRDFDKIHRIEDVNLGRVLSARLGWSSPAFGGDRTRLILAGTATDGWTFGERQVLLARADLSGRLRQGAVENGELRGGFRYYHRTFGDGLFVARVSGEMAQNLDFENQLLLGGDNGLRGYPLRYQSGDRRFLLTLEQRFYSSREFFHLLHAGAAVFFDAGRAWFVEPPPSFLSPPAAQRQLLKDAGVGLRLGSSRSAQGAIIHLDLAVPLDRGRSIKGVQYLVTTSETF
jgi:outer membrane protein assembly factor BamA